MKKITAIIPTFNEEDNIKRALDSISFADEIIVIDSYSKDNTVEIIKSYPQVTLLQRTFDDFSSQKNYAIEKASYEWVFLLDADEQITKTLQEEIKSKLEKPANFSSFYVYRNFFFKEKKICFSGWQRDKVIRLFKKNVNFYEGKVHEKIKSQGEIGFLKNKINHYSYKNYEQYKAKLDKYAKLQAQELFEKHTYVTPYHTVFKPTIRFFIHYIVRLGFLDGKKGLVMSYLSGYGVSKRYKELSILKKISSKKTAIDGNLKIGFDAKRVFHNTTGLGNYGRDLIRILSEYYPSNVYHLYNPKPRKVNRLKIKGNIYEILPTNKFWKTFSSLWRQGPILHQINNDAVDIFHGLSGEIPKGIQNTSIKTIVTIHDLIFIRYPKLYSFFDRKIHLNKVNFAANNADKIIAISEQTKRDIISFLKVDASKIEVIYQGCHESFKSDKSLIFKKEVKNKFNLPDSFILNVGAINERKNILTLIKSIEDIETPLIIVGAKTSYFKILESYIVSNNLSQKVRFLENISMLELSAIYQMASVFVYPSIFEGFGIPIIEALYSKTPVITSTGSCFAEAGGPNSIYVEPNDIEVLSEKIKLVLNDESLRNIMIEKGLKFAQKFNDEYIAENFQRTYCNLIV